MPPTSCASSAAMAIRCGATGRCVRPPGIGGGRRWGRASRDGGRRRWPWCWRCWRPGAPIRPGSAAHAGGAAGQGGIGTEPGRVRRRRAVRRAARALAMSGIRGASLRDSRPTTCGASVTTCRPARRRRPAPSGMARPACAAARPAFRSIRGPLATGNPQRQDQRQDRHRIPYKAGTGSRRPRPAARRCRTGPAAPGAGSRPSAGRDAGARAAPSPAVIGQFTALFLVPSSYLR